jgi:hypothetical protein
MAYNNLANVLRGDVNGTDDVSALRAAGRCYAMAVRLSPTYLEAYRNLGNLLRERPTWRRSAVRAYRSALSLQPDGRTVLLNLGETLQWLGRPAAANKTFALAVARGVWQHAQQRPSQYVPGLRAAPWWELSEVPELLRLFRSKETIETLRDEGIALLRRGTPFLNYFSPALVAGKWSDVMLAVAGFRQPGADHAPRSYALYEAFGEAVTTMVLLIASDCLQLPPIASNGGVSTTGARSGVLLRPVARRAAAGSLRPHQRATAGSHWPFGARERCHARGQRDAPMAGRRGVHLRRLV